ncbi:BMP family lipoprotein [Microterricola viridarii]|uniref:ABC transporter substrate-binding protein PnrA-like domain-containing protein n=1 Tax=Microterricola viridarii TaxID=412690 RepID=A0A0Y0P6Z1_9MICO|nr:BMP family ABC transporter substrate-binding protein [Microterricola viridarii]AMB59979.1 hypothetical protein AWU67_15195 [Microterricola viridarii]
MNKRLIGGIAIMATAVLALTACGGSNDTAGSGSAGGSDSFSAVNIVSGNLGDQGFFDDAARGMASLEAGGFKTQNIQGEVGSPAQWKTNLESVSGSDWDVVITGTAQMHDILDSAAAKYPEQNYVTYDDVVDQPNVASILYKQNEGSYLAGVLAAAATTNPDKFPLATGSKKLGLVGGMDIPIINDFVAGFKKGAEAVDPSIEVLVSYVGDFADANKGFDQATAMYKQGADVVFQVAGGAGQGVFTAAKDQNRYAIGVDANQNGLQEGHILASMLKNIGASLESAVKAAKDGTLKYGETTEYGLANDGVSLVFDDNGGIVPQDIQDLVKTYAQKVIDGEITVPTAM